MQNEIEQKRQIGEILEQVMTNKIDIVSAKEKIKKILPITHKDFEMAKSAPELEMVIKREMNWN